MPEPAMSGEAPDAAYLYDWECRHVLGRRDQDLGFWIDLVASTPGPVLELACGTGRITVPLAQSGEGRAIVGLDRDPAMLAALHRRQAGAAWPLSVAADMRRFALATRFGVVFVAYNSLQLLVDPQDMTACLSCARRHLAPNGLIGVEVTDFQSGGADGRAGAVEEVLAGAEGITLSGCLVHDLEDRSSRYRRRFLGPGWAVEDQVVLRSLDAGELATTLRAAGLTVVHEWQNGRTTRAVAAASTAPEGTVLPA